MRGTSWALLEPYDNPGHSLVTYCWEQQRCGQAEVQPKHNPIEMATAVLAQKCLTGGHCYHGCPPTGQAPHRRQRGVSWAVCARPPAAASPGIKQLASI